MEKTYFSQYIDDMNNIIKEARIKHDKASIALENARARNARAQVNQEYSHDKKLGEAAQYREAETEYKKSVENIRTDTETAFEALRQSLAKHIAEYTTADPDRVDQGAVMLLNSGAMRDTDLVALANKFWNNPTMLKLVAGEAEKNLTDSKVARHLATAIAAYIAPDTRLRLFDEGVSIAMRTLDSRGDYAGTFQKKWDEEFYQSIKDGMSALDTFNLEVM